ncbi:hypothetical protein D3C87_1080940 [compost metagenome]
MAMKISVSIGALFASTGEPNRIEHSDSSTKAAVVVLTVSQPRRDISETSVGPILPRTPKIARDKVRLGARPRRPAIEMIPTTANEPAAPMIATMIACQIASPRNATSVAPSGRPRMEMLAANQTQNSCSGCPLHSASGTGSMPRVSSCPALCPTVDELMKVLLFAFFVVVAMMQNDKTSRPSSACLRDPLRVVNSIMRCAYRWQASSHRDQGVHKCVFTAKTCGSWLASDGVISLSATPTAPAPTAQALGD